MFKSHIQFGSTEWSAVIKNTKSTKVQKYKSTKVSNHLYRKITDSVLIN